MLYNIIVTVKVVMFASVLIFALTGLVNLSIDLTKAIREIW